MFKKYRVFRYIQRQKSGKAYEKVLKKRFKVTDAELNTWTNLGTNVDCELKSFYDWDAGDSRLELTGAGSEYIASIRRECFLVLLGALLALAIERFPALLEYLRGMLR